MYNNFMKKKISYKDIAEQANVSVSTVSRFYNDGYVSKKARAKITEAIENNNFYPNTGARIVRGRDNSVFIIMPIWAQNLYSSIVSGITIACARKGRRVNTTYAGNSTKEYMDAIRYAFSWKPTAIVVFVPQYHKELFDFLKGLEDVTVILYEHQVNGINSIKVDITKGFYTLTEKLLNSSVNRNEDGSLVSKKVAFISDGRLSSTQKTERYQGFERACVDNNYEYYEYAFSSKKTLEDISQISKFLRQHNIHNIVCSTHETYVALAQALGTKEYNYTDIGYQSIYDNIKKYVVKIFIDYPSLGFKIEDMITKSKMNNEVLTKTIPIEIIGTAKR
ncbi:LacI family DNA-binding transcriptional regulator [Mycoplasma sp. OR1901]|nr:LacI family DNA-binding transcriptional regulator [Mycoplasma sp. OR1901]